MGSLCAQLVNASPRRAYGPVRSAGTQHTVRMVSVEACTSFATTGHGQKQSAWCLPTFYALAVRKVLVMRHVLLDATHLSRSSVSRVPRIYRGSPR